MTLYCDNCARKVNKLNKEGLCDKCAWAEQEQNKDGKKNVLAANRDGK